MAITKIGMDLFIDESGYTGPDLLNREQPILARSSTILSEEEAEALVSASFDAARRGNELKHSRLSRTKKGRAAVVDFVARLPKDKIAFYVFHKQFTLLSYLLDFWLEPAMYADGFNYYERGGNIASANVSNIVLSSIVGPEGFRELLRRFQVMTRDRTDFAYVSFWEYLSELSRRHPLVDESPVGMLLGAERRLGRAHLDALPDRLLDLGEYGVLDTIVHWRRSKPEVRFTVVHDESRAIQNNLEFWNRLIAPDAPPAVVGQDRRIIEFPLPVDSVTLAASDGRVSLQVADVVAGAAAAVFAAKATNRRNDYVDDLEGAGLMDGLAGGVWPGTAISPEELDTDGDPLGDAADYIGRLTRAPR